MITLSPIEHVRALLRERPAQVPSCLVCRGPVRREEACVRLRGGGLVHRECATYRMRQVGSRNVLPGRPRR